MTDDLTLAVTLNLYDIPCDTFVISYDDNLYEGEEADWRYGQATQDPPVTEAAPWDGTSAAMRGTSTLLDGFVTLTFGLTEAAGAADI
ncbi:MAG: hypothetical protein GWN12_19755, partial [Thermoplasmata archaeon]|nr:hypothetical protein [Thermoplasmata archaeon]NIW90951.1 hypothetical protein [Thermoplasmata archaeon]